MTVPASDRIEYMDIARGIGILVVVLAHNDLSLTYPFAAQVITSFHMPLFFFLSGYFLKTAVPFWGFVKRRFDTLLKPYLFTLFIIYFTAVSFEKMSFRTALQRIVKSLYGTGYYIDWTQLWFLPHLFIVSVYAFLFFLLLGSLRRSLRWVVLLATLGIGVLFVDRFYPFALALFGKEYELFGLPFSLDLVLVSGFFFILGNEVRQVTTGKTFESLFVLIGAGAGLLLLNYFFQQGLDLNTRVYDSFVLSTLKAMAGIFFALALARQLDLHPSRLSALLKYFGRISLFILIFHVPLQSFWAQKVLDVSGNTPLSIWVGFFMGVAGSALIYELFIKANPVASWWFGRQAEMPAQTEFPRTE